jgi:hypothetical protein
MKNLYKAPIVSNDTSHGKLALKINNFRFWSENVQTELEIDSISQQKQKSVQRLKAPFRKDTKAFEKISSGLR